MGNSNIDDYLQNGIYGVKQTKPDERRKFLGTIRERIVVALTKSQVMEPGVYPEVRQLLKEHPQATLLLNGDLDYSYLSEYIKVARSLQVPFSIVTNKDQTTAIGLVLAYDHAIDKPNIYINKKEPGKVTVKKQKNGLFSGLKKILTK